MAYEAPPARTTLNDTYPNPSNAVFKAGIGDLYDYITALLGTTGNPEEAMDALKIINPFGVQNLQATFAVAANALTITMKGNGAVNLSSSNPAYIAHRSSGASTGSVTLRKMTANFALTVSSGSTLGTLDTESPWLHLYVIDNAGTQELAISQKFFGFGGLISTTAEGGAGGANTADVMYSATARASVPFRYIGRFKAAQTTAGTWTATPSNVEQAGQGSYGRVNLDDVVTLSGVISPASLTADQNNWAPAGIQQASVIRFSTDGGRNITGISCGQTDGRLILLMCTSNTAHLMNQDTGSTAANRIIVPGTSLAITGNHGVLLRYDGTSNRWRVVMNSSLMAYNDGSTHDAPGTFNASVFADYENANDDTRAMTCGSSVRHPGMAKAWLQCGITGTINGDWGVTSVTDTGTGQVTVTLDQALSAFSQAAYMSNAHHGTLPRHTQLETRSTTAPVFRCYDDATTLSDPINWCITIHGDN